MPSIKGTSSVSDARERSKALKATRFPKSFTKTINLEKVNKPVLTQWIEQKVTSILGFDDEIVSSTAINLFLPSEGQSPDPRRAQLDLVGFLGEEESASFAKELWNLMLEAESSSSGIPITLLEEKKKELSQKAAIHAKPAAHPPVNARPAPNHVARHRNPEMNRFVQEATRRAQAARQMVGAPSQDDLPPPPVVPAARAEAPVPIPVSPPHPSDKDNLSGANRNSSRPERNDGNRKMAARDSDYYHRDNRSEPQLPPPPLPPPPYREGSYPPPPGRAYGRGDGDKARRPYSARSRSDSRSMDHNRRREDDFGRRRRDPVDRDRRRYYDDDREIEELERRLATLKKQFPTNRNYALDEEIEDVKDRLHELERRRRRHRREREEEEYHRRKRRRRASSSESRHRGRSPKGRRRRSSRSPASDRRRRSASSESDNKRPSSRRSPSSDSEDCRRRRGSSSESQSSSSSDSRSDRRPQRKSPSPERRRDHSRDNRRRRARSNSHSSYTSSSSSDYSDDKSR